VILRSVNEIEHEAFTTLHFTGVKTLWGQHRLVSSFPE